MTKTTKLLMLVCIALTTNLFTSCVNTIETEKETRQISLKVQKIEQVAFTRSISGVVGRISYALFKGTEQVWEVEQLAADADFGTLTADVEYGTYTLVTVAHNGNASASISSPSNITFADRLTDTFYALQTVTVSKTSATTINMTLDRCVAKFELNHTDALPNYITSMTFDYTGSGLVLDATTGFAPNTTAVNRVISIPSNFAGTSGNSFFFYAFLPSDEVTMDVTAVAKDAQGTSHFSMTFADAPFKVNRISRYVGAFFKTGESMTGQVTVNNTWLDTVETPF